MLRELHPPLGQRIDMRGLELCLPIATEVSIAEIIGQDVDNIGRTGLVGSNYAAESQECRAEQAMRQESIHCASSRPFFMVDSNGNDSHKTQSRK